MFDNVTANYFCSGVQLIYTLENKIKDNEKTRNSTYDPDMLKDFSNFLKI